VLSHWGIQNHNLTVHANKVALHALCKHPPGGPYRSTPRAGFHRVVRYLHMDRGWHPGCDGASSLIQHIDDDDDDDDADVWLSLMGIEC